MSPGARIRQHGGGVPGRISQLPVLRVHGPVYQRHGKPGPLGIVQQPVGGPHPVAALPQDGADGSVRAADLGLHRRPGGPLELGVAPGVIPHLMALRLHALHQGPVGRDLLPHQKKGGAGAPRPQSVQQPPRGVGPRAVVKGQGHVARRLLRRFAAGGGTRRRIRGQGCRRGSRPGRRRPGGNGGCGDAPAPDRQQRRRQQEKNPLSFHVVSPLFRGSLHERGKNTRAETVQNAA
jgi:hypothetical protein